MIFVKLVYFERKTDQKMSKCYCKKNCLSNGVTNDLK